MNINFPLIFKQAYRNRFCESIITEGKHWPEDYVKTAFNTIKNSELGKQSWYSDNYINQDLKTIVDEFNPLSHKNSNLGYFATIIKWFVQYSGKDKQKYQEFLERKLDGIIKTLLWLSTNPTEESKLKEQIKTKWTLDDFEKYQKEVEDQISREQSDKLKNTKLEDKGYKIIKIDSYEELHKKFGGDKTGYKGRSEWCHTNGNSTYNSWTNDGQYNFFVLAKKDWEKIKPPNPETTNAYDDYGTSLIALLVDVASSKLLNATLRWNHIIEPSETIKGASVDKAFLGWGDLAEVTGKNLEAEIKKELEKERKELEKSAKIENEKGEKYLKRLLAKGTTTFSSDTKIFKKATKIEIPEGIKIIGYEAFTNCSKLTSVTIPNSVVRIGTGAFTACTALTSITIPDSVIIINDYAFQFCTSLTSVIIPDSVTSIEEGLFYNCSSLTSVIIPNSVTNIEKDAFFDCSSLTSVTIPNSVTSIGAAAFGYCKGLTSVTIPDSVTSIEDYAFFKCNNLKTIYCSEEIWNKFKKKFPDNAVRKNLK